MGLNNCFNVIHKQAINNALIAIVPYHRRFAKANKLHKNGRKGRWELKADDKTCDLLDIIGEIFLPTHPADR